MHHIRKMTTMDLPAVEALDPHDPATRWEAADYQAVLDCAGGAVWVAESQGRLVACLAFLVVARHPQPSHIDLLNVAVDPALRRRGLATALLQRLAQEWPSRLQATVPESNLPAQLLLRAGGYRAVRVLRGYFGVEDGYLLQREGCAQACEPLSEAAAGL
jgi:ribosomal protein S18 acetylase RimI-like enzyme